MKIMFAIRRTMTSDIDEMCSRSLREGCSWNSFFVSLVSFWVEAMEEGSVETLKDAIERTKYDPL